LDKKNLFGIFDKPKKESSRTRTVVNIENENNRDDPSSFLESIFGK
jgi:hypothetical protein